MSKNEITYMTGLIIKAIILHFYSYSSIIYICLICYESNNN